MALFAFKKTNMNKTIIAVAALLMPAVMMAEYAKPDDVVTYKKKDYVLTTLWKHDNNEANNPVNFVANGTMMASQMLAIGDYLYLPKFKTEYPSAQQFYVVNAWNGTVHDPVDVLSADEFGSLPFESIGKVVNEVTTDADEYFMVGAPNARIKDEKYLSAKGKTLPFAFYKLDFSNPLNPKATLSHSGDFYKSHDYDAYKVMYDNVAYGSYVALKTSSGDYRVFGRCIPTESINVTSDLPQSVTNRITYTESVYFERMNAFADRDTIYYSPDGLYTLSTLSNRTSYAKNAQLYMPNYIGSNTNYFFANFSSGKNSTRYVPSIVESNGYMIKSITPLSSSIVSEDGKTVGNAITYFKFNNKYFLVYAAKVSDDTTNFKVVALPNCTDAKLSFDDAEVLWEVPFAVTDKTDSTTGENLTSACALTRVSPNNTTGCVDIFLYAQGQGLGAFRLQLDADKETNAVNDITTDSADWSYDGSTLSANGAISVYNTLGARVISTADTQVDVSRLAAGIYIARCGASTYKFVVK